MKILDVEMKRYGSDDFAYYMCETPAGTVQLVQYAPYGVTMWRGEWFPVDGHRRYSIGLHTRPEAVADDVDSFLCALVRKMVEPIAKRLDDRSQALLDARPTVDPVTALHYETLSDEIEECADLVRAFYAPDAEESGDEGR